MQVVKKKREKNKYKNIYVRYVRRKEREREKKESLKLFLASPANVYELHKFDSGDTVENEEVRQRERGGIY